MGMMAGNSGNFGDYVMNGDYNFSELDIKTHEDRKAIHRVYLAIKKATPGMSFDSFFAATHGSLAEFKGEDESNFAKGRIALKKARLFYRWIVEHHLPLACHIAPEVFDPSMRTHWDIFQQNHVIYGKLTIIFPDGIGLTRRSINQPVSETPVRMGQKFLFQLECGLDGSVLPLESLKGKTYPLSLHPDQITLPVTINKGQTILPLKFDGSYDPLSEVDDGGLRSYHFLIADKDLITEAAQSLETGKEVIPKKLNHIAYLFKKVDPSHFELHRLNVVFSNPEGSSPKAPEASD